MRIRVEHKNRVMWGYAEYVGGSLWVHSEGKTYVIEGQEATSGKRKKSGKASGGNIEAPMPGKVTKILKMSGERVSAGDSVVVMEAMKMEYTLKADVNGQIQSIDTKLNEQVPLGKVLVRIKQDAE